MRGVAVVPLAIGILLSPGCKKPNHAPDTPAVPSGPTSCAVGVSYIFSSSAVDPDGDRVSIRFDWGDGDTSDWSACFASGETVTMDHSWSSPGTYAVKVQARDEDSIALAWSAGLGMAVYHEWARAFGGIDDDQGCSVQQTRDGGYIVGGWTRSYGAGEEDFWLIKTDAYGDTVWARTYGGVDLDMGFSAQQTQDGGYVMVGETRSFGAGCGDLWLIKTDADGDTVWTRTFGGAAEDEGYSVRQTQDGAYIMVGTTSSYGAGGEDVWFLKIDARGQTLWARTFGGPDADRGCDIQQTSDGGYIIAGITQIPGTGIFEILLVRADANGDTVWTSTLGSANTGTRYSVRQTRDNGYVVTGGTANGHEENVLLIKTSPNGDTVWTRTYGAPDFDDEGLSVRQTSDGGYVVAGGGMSLGADPYFGVWLIRADDKGDTVWTRRFGADVRYSSGQSVEQTQDGGYITAGCCLSLVAGGTDLWLIKTGPNGEVDSVGGK